jgi:sarcosine oxidase subunit delta
MASLITCPHCGARPKEEFTIRGSASVVRPAPSAPDEDWHRYVHVRDNERGRILEYWHHTAGCRRWLIVDRSNVTHEVFSVIDAADRAREAAQ